MALFSAGCQSDGSDGATACSEAAVANLCPPGTTPSMEAALIEHCAGEASGTYDPISGGGDGAVSAACGSTGTCQFACVMLEPCPCGTSSFNAEGFTCAECSACGNGTCEPTENLDNCAVDCASTPCGDGICQSGENPDNCPQDCEPPCGNGTCDGGENPDNCPQDCEPPCGNGTCDGGETPENCPQDCETACGNDICDGDETSVTCPQDCQSACGNGECERGENPDNCPQDCESACGNGECDASETPESCPADCRAACGDGTCERGETPETCPADCATGCVSGDERCNGDHREVCNGQGEFDQVDCPSETICRQLGGGGTECVAAGQAVCNSVSFCCDGAYARNVNTECDDGLFCTEATTCQSDGTCGQPQARDCSASVTEPTCQAAICDENADLCRTQPQNDDAACDNAATAGDDHCDEGQCVANGCQCVGENECCDGCNPRNAAAACDDGLYCTVGETCTAGGVCGDGMARNCAASVNQPECQAPACDDLIDACVARAANTGADCNDGTICTVATTCRPDGTCGGGQPRDCSASVQTPACQRAACTEGAGGCHAVADHIGDGCDDGTFCYDNTVCQADGTCAGGDELNCAAAQDDAQCQAAGRCDDALRMCMADAVNEGLPCEDGDLCTVADACGDGVCVTGAQRQCPAPGVCYHSGECVAETGECVNMPRDDGDDCSGLHMQASCNAGECQFQRCSGTYGDCNDDLGADGCETDLSQSADHCGACGNNCRANGRFDGARVECGGGCNFLGCNDGFADADGDCADGGPCTNGCEVCAPIGDGTIDFPDDGVDSDCSGGDATNSDAQGWYVDVNFEPAGSNDCGGVPRGTAACPFTDLYEGMLEAQALQQDWSAANAKRTMYVASGTYSDMGEVVDITESMILAGGYQRNGAVWTRDEGNAPSVLDSRINGGPAVTSRGGLGALDNFEINANVIAQSSLLLSRVTLGGEDELQLNSMVDGAWIEIRGSTVDAVVVGCGDNRNHQHAVKVVGSTIRGDLVVFATEGDNGWITENRCHFVTVRVESTQIMDDVSIASDLRGWFTEVDVAGDFDSTLISFAGGTVTGYFSVYYSTESRPDGIAEFEAGAANLSQLSSLQLFGYVDVDDSVMRAVEVSGDSAVSLNDTIVEDSTFRSTRTMSIRSSVLRRVEMTAGGKVSIYFRALVEASTFDRLVNLSSNYGNNFTAESNLFSRGVELETDYSGRDLVFANNTVVGSGVPDEPAIIIRDGSSGTIVLQNNAIVRPSGEGVAAACVAIQEFDADTDLAVLRNNYFIGYGGDDILYIDEGNQPNARLARVNGFADLLECGRGGNVQIENIEDAGFVSLDPASPDYLRISANSPLVNGGASYPLDCIPGTIIDLHSDQAISGPRICGGTIDIGAAEYCE